MPLKLVPVTSLSATYQEAVAAALAASKNSYCPYSDFQVGAALVHPDGTVTAGCNYENCIFQASCAERCAILAANAKGQRRATAVAVVGYSGKAGVAQAAGQLVSPCGLCRQMLHEVNQLTGKAPMEIILIAGDHQRAALVPLTQLLPCSFGPADFGVDISSWSDAKCPAAPRGAGAAFAHQSIFFADAKAKKGPAKPAGKKAAPATGAAKAAAKAPAKKAATAKAAAKKATTAKTATKKSTAVTKKKK
jgi:cytidine deaminase